ncbi:MAG: DUF6288 domain-containing protein [Planctomycetes bacterium]|nr:DUF6288 domain-containing protein [Planctomycetota bacterium]
MRFTATLLLVALLALPALAQMPPMPGQEGTDAFNLGVLGAEGLPIKKPDEALGLPRGAVAIKVTKVLDGGPALDAGLKADDLVVAVGGTFLTIKHMVAVYQLVAAMEAVSSTKKGETTLTVIRDGKPVNLKLKLPALGPHGANCPTGCGRCEKLIDDSLKILTGLQEADGAFPIGIGGQNGRVAVTSLAGLSFLASGSTTKDGPYADNVARAAKWVTEHCGKEDAMPGGERPTGGANWNQTNWSLGYGCLFLTEIYRLDPSPELEQKLTDFMQTIEKNQEASGGWAHGPGGPNALKYVELQIVGNLELAALGALRKAGFKPSQAVIDKGVAYMISTSSGDGGIGYSANPGQQGMGDPGRTALGAWAFGMLDMKTHPFFARMGSYFKRSMEDLPGGHVSPIMHYTSAAFACMHFDASYWKSFIGLFRLEILAARRPDGTFSARPTEETVSMHNNTDRELGPAWTTASYSLILQVPRGKLKILTGMK